MGRRLTIMVLIALSAACIRPAPRYLCDVGNRCPEGLLCIGGLCVDDPGGSPSPHDAGAVCPWEIAGTLQLPSDVVTGALDGPSRNSSTSCFASDLPGGEAIYTLEVTTRTRVKLVGSSTGGLILAVRRACDVADDDLGCWQHGGSMLMVTLDPGRYFVLVEGDGSGPEQSYTLNLGSVVACEADGECGAGQGCVDGTCVPCAEGAPCFEACQDEEPNQPPYCTFTNAWKYRDGSVSNAGALFMTTTEARRCQWTRQGDHCYLIDCLFSDWDGDSAIALGHSAGTITFSSDRGAVVFEPDANGLYTMVRTPSWQVGDEITVQATGAEIPTFSRTYLFPDALTVTSPVADHAGSMPAIQRANEFVVTWRPLQGLVWIGIEQGRAYEDLDWQGLACTFDATVGTGTIPAELLQFLKMDSQLPTGFGVAHRVKQCLKLGEFQLQVTAMNGSWWDVTVE